MPDLPWPSGCLTLMLGAVIMLMFVVLVIASVMVLMRRARSRRRNARFMRTFLVTTVSDSSISRHEI